MAMTPFALSLLGVQSDQGRRASQQEAGEGSAPNVRQPRTLGRHGRRATSYYNSFQTACTISDDNPPPYDLAIRHRSVLRREPAHETLPAYTCTVAAEAKMLLHWESQRPFYRISPPEESQWKEVYVVLRGTLLSLHHVKDGKAGKLFKSYTLQHAEIGLAADTKHTVLVPNTRWAHFVPASHQRKAWSKDPDLFKAERQHILRLRLETDQILLADASEERIQELTHAISAGIDISHAIDERSIPRQCTVPRRNRRRHVQQNANPVDVNDSSLLAEQERILRDMYPTFAESRSQATASRPVLYRMTSDGSSSEDSPAGTSQSRMRDEDEIDMAAVREDFEEPSRREAPSRQTTATVADAAYISEGMIYATAPSNFSTSGKWEPPHFRSPHQVQRYIRRCMPVLLADSGRASDIVIERGRRKKINWRMQLFEDWELCPPSYKSHGFSDVSHVEDDEGLALDQVKTVSQNSQSEFVTQANDGPVLASDEEPQDLITPAVTRDAIMELPKMTATRTIPRSSKTENTRCGSRETEIHGVVLCL